MIEAKTVYNYVIEHLDFIIAHIPRTGGDAAAAYFNFLKKFGLEVSVSSMLTHEKHVPFVKTDTKNKKLILVIRKLPDYFNSYLKMALKYGIYPEYTPLPKPTEFDVLSFESAWGYTYNKEIPGPLANLPDRYIKYMTSDMYFKPTLCLRQESLLEDILDLVKPYVDISPELLGSVLTKKPETHDYEWTEEQIKIMYKNNPIWESLEREFLIKPQLPLAKKYIEIDAFLQMENVAIPGENHENQGTN